MNSLRNKNCFKCNHLTKLFFLPEKQQQQYFELNQDENIAYQNVRDAVKAVVRGRTIALKCLSQKDRFQTSGFTVGS